MNAKVKFALLLGTLVIFASPSRATTIARSGSGYGAYDSGYMSTSGYADCESGAFDTRTGDACEAFEAYPTDDEPGATAYLLTGGPSKILDLEDFGDVSSGTYTLSVLNYDVSATPAGSGVGVLTCDDPSDDDSTAYAVDSGDSEISGLPCTPSDDVSDITQSTGSDLVQFAIDDPSGVPFDLVLYTLDGNLNLSPATAAPEPGAFALLGLGLVSLALLAVARRRSKTRAPGAPGSAVRDGECASELC
jgi:hypothetical protein